MPETKLEVTRESSGAISARIIAIAVLFGCIYYASSVVITLIFSILIAAVLEPGARFLERLRLPRWLSSLIMVLLMLAVGYLAVYGIYHRGLDFMENAPKLAAKLKQMTAHLQATAQNFQQSTRTIIPSSADSNLPTVRLQQESPWAQFLLRGIGSVYAFMVTVMFIPFLVFFMLNSKDRLWMATLNLFPIENRQKTEDVIHNIGWRPPRDCAARAGDDWEFLGGSDAVLSLGTFAGMPGDFPGVCFTGSDPEFTSIRYREASESSDCTSDGCGR